MNLHGLKCIYNYVAGSGAVETWRIWQSRQAESSEEKNVISQTGCSSKDRDSREKKRCISALQIAMLRNVDPDVNSDFPFPHRSDLSWEDYYAVLVWWGKSNRGSPGIDEEVDHPQHGWVPLGNFYEWTMRATWLDDEGVPVEGRYSHSWFPAALNKCSGLPKARSGLVWETCRRRHDNDNWHRYARYFDRRFLQQICGQNI